MPRGAVAPPAVRDPSTPAGYAIAAPSLPCPSPCLRLSFSLPLADAVLLERKPHPPAREPGPVRQQPGPPHSGRKAQGPSVQRDRSIDATTAGALTGRRPAQAQTRHCDHAFGCQSNRPGCAEPARAVSATDPYAGAVCHGTACTRRLYTEGNELTGKQWSEAQATRRHE